jgi:hypothetical protein
MVIYACNFSYLGGRGRRIMSSRPPVHCWQVSISKQNKTKQKNPTKNKRQKAKPKN